MSEKFTDYTDTPKPQTSTEEIAAKKKTRIVDTIAKVVTLLVAFLFWLYVFATNDATKVENKKFELVPVEVRGSETVSDLGLAVQNMSMFNLDVTLKGTRNALSDVKIENVKAYINIADITAPGTYIRTVLYDIPNGVAVSDAMGRTEVEITVDTIASKEFVVDGSKVFVDNFVLDENCTVDTANIVLNIDHVKFEAPSMVLNRIVALRIRATQTLTMEGNSTLSAVVEALDTDGEVVTASNLKTVATKNSVIRSSVTVTLPLIKEKMIPVTIRDKDGFVTGANISISPAYVTIKGDPFSVGGLTSLVLDAFSSKMLTANADGKAVFTVSPTVLPEGIVSVNDKEGNALGADSITVTVTLAKEKTLTVPKSYITFYGKKIEIEEESLQLSVRTLADESYFALLQAVIAQGERAVTLIADISNTDVKVGDKITLTVVFSGEFQGKIYEVYPDGVPYTVTVREVK